MTHSQPREPLPHSCDWYHSPCTLLQEALEERAFMLSAAPYMNSPLPIMIPLYK